MIRVKGYKINHKKVYRIYREMALQLPVKKKQGRKLNKDSFTKELTEARYVNHVWGEDFLKSKLGE